MRRPTPESSDADLNTGVVERFESFDVDCNGPRSARFSAIRRAKGVRSRYVGIIELAARGMQPRWRNGSRPGRAYREKRTRVVEQDGGMEMTSPIRAVLVENSGHRLVANAVLAITSTTLHDSLGIFRIGMWLRPARRSSRSSSKGGIDFRGALGHKGRAQRARS